METTPQQTGGNGEVIDYGAQTRFLILFGLLSMIPLALFFWFGLKLKKSSGGGAEGAGAPKVSFVEVGTEVGIAFVHENGAQGEKLLPETMGGGCAFFDFDNDGDMDLLLVNGSRWPGAEPLAAGSAAPTHALYRNDGKMFTDVTAGSGLDRPMAGMGVAVGDYDNDGFWDVYLTGVGGNRLLRNTGVGKFQDVTEASGVRGSEGGWSTSAAFLDYDNDGDLDLFVCNYVQWSREIDLKLDYRLGSIGRAYGPPTGFQGTFPTLYRNEEGGRFANVSAEAGLLVRNKATGVPVAKSLGVAPVDLDNDGWMDLVVANDTAQNFVFLNKKDGTFEEIGGRSGVAFGPFGGIRGAMGIDTARFVNTDTLGISIGNFANEMTALYLSQEDPLLFADQAIDQGIGNASRHDLTFGVFFFDFDLDGHLDLLTANGHIEPDISKVTPTQAYRQAPRLFWQRVGAAGKGSFIPMPAEAVGADFQQPLAGRGSAFADIDGDGDLDVVVTQVGGPPVLFRNDLAPGANWVRIKLEGKRSNRSAIGAKVRLRSGGRVFNQQVMPTRGYLSQSEPVLTFGLGESERIDEVVVTWPGGRRQTVQGVRARELATIVESAE